MGSFAPKGHARVDADHPNAFAICDCCGFQYNHNKLRWQMQWYGTELRKTGFLHCPTCYDQPSIQRPPPYPLPADPVPIANPRTEPSGSGDQVPTTVAGLPSAAVAGVQAYHFVTDSTVAKNFGTYGIIVVGGGQFFVPVVSDGTDWRIA